jgi:hypothetical protein
MDPRRSAPDHCWASEGLSQTSTRPKGYCNRSEQPALWSLTRITSPAGRAVSSMDSASAIAAPLTRTALASRGPSIDLLRLVAQLPTQDFANIGFRQLGPELHQPWDLVGREPRPAVGDQVCIGEV